MLFLNWLKFYIILYLSIFFFFDEEPFFDMTDWNIIHIFFFLCCLLSIIYENILKSRYGQFVFKDQVLLFSIFSYWTFLQNYILLVIVIFCFHCLTPLEIELFELIEIYNNLFNWCFFTIIFTLFNIFILTFLILLINFLINWNNKKFVFLIFYIFFLFLIIILIFLLWDFLFSSLTATLFWNNFKIFYIQSRSSLTYNNTLNLNDQFDWHREQVNFFIIRFEDLYSYFILLIFIIIFVYFLFVIYFILNDLNNLFFYNKDLSYLSFSIIFTLLNNFCYIFYINYILLFLVGLRVSFKLLIENLDYFFYF